MAELKQVFWTTKKVEEWMKNYSNGVSGSDSPWADGQIGVRKPNIPFEYTEFEIQEIIKCKMDIIYFANTYCWCLQGTKGYQPIKLRDYQIDMLNAYQDNRFNITLSCRQIGKTVTAGIFLMHEVLFNYDRHIGIAANKYATAIEIVDKIKEMMSYLPYWLKRGVCVNNQSNMVFDNGCKIYAQATTKKSFIGYTIHTLYLDEFAHVEPNVIDSFYENIMPTVSSMEDSKIIITSTPNGCNRYYTIYRDANEGKNTYHPITINWWQVPGRDNEWYKKMVNDLGQDEFDRQYGNSFLSTGNMLLSPDTFKRVHEARTDYVYRDIQEVEFNYEEEFNNLKFDPNFNIEDLRNQKCRFVIGCDLAEGGGKKSDYTVMQILQVLPKDMELIRNQKIEKVSDMFKLKQVGLFRSNTASLEIVAKLLYILVVQVMIVDNVKVVIEYNTFGSEFMTSLKHIFGDKNQWEPSVIQKYIHNKENNVRKYGLRLNGQNKQVFCVNFRSLCSSCGFDFNENITIIESEVFSKVGNTYKANGASDIHDDTMMALIDAATIIDQSSYISMLLELLENYPEHHDFYYKNVIGKNSEHQSSVTFSIPSNNTQQYRQFA